MDMRFFFEGKLGREEAASAFLATMLSPDNCPEFREGFFSLLKLPQDTLAELQGEQWNVAVEEKNVDIVMRGQSSHWIVLIENKIKAASKTAGQLNKYYRLFCASDAKTRLGCIFLGPKVSTGDSETACTRLREGDFACSVGWDQVLEILDSLEPSPEDGRIIRSCGSAVKRMIDAGSQAKYPIAGQRMVLQEIIKDVAARLSADHPDMKLMTWVSRDSHQIYSCRSKMTADMQLVFPVAAFPPYEPQVQDGEGRLELSIQSNFKLSASGMKDQDARQLWQKLRQSAHVQIVSDYEHAYKPNGWYHAQKPVRGTQDEIARMLLQMSQRLFSGLEGMMPGLLRARQAD